MTGNAVRLSTADHHVPDGPAQVALLWDLDNVCPRVPDLATFAQTLIETSGPAVALHAAGRRHLFRTARPVLEPLGFTVHSGGHRRNGADHMLLDRDRLLHRRGVTHYLVAIHDHAFADIPPTAHVTVLASDAHMVSERLRHRADVVTAIALPGRERGSAPSTLFVSPS